MSDHQHGGEDCKEVFALLSQYLDMELPPDACKEIETHLADCPPCIEFAESLRKTVELCRQYRSNEVPPQLSDSAKAELRAAYERVQSRQRPGRPQAV